MATGAKVASKGAIKAIEKLPDGRVKVTTADGKSYVTSEDFIKIDKNGNEYIDPFTAKKTPITEEVTGKYGKIQDDHILPKTEIDDIPDFKELDPKDQKEIKAMYENSQPLPGKLNASKNNRVQGTDNEWTGYKKENKPLHPEYSQALKDAQDELRETIQNEIKRRLNK